jgi:uncharacterized protein
MILGVMSDTHGNRRLMHKVAGLMTQDHDAEVILHIGDNYDDAEELGSSGLNVRMVPGLYCDVYHDGRVSNWHHETFDGVSVAFTHADQDLRAVDQAADVVITGHTHVASIERIGRSVYLNPGHLKGPKDRGERASFAIIETRPREVRIAVHEASGRLRFEKIISRREMGEGQTA